MILPPRTDVRLCLVIPANFGGCSSNRNGRCRSRGTGWRVSRAKHRIYGRPTVSPGRSSRDARGVGGPGGGATHRKGVTGRWTRGSALRGNGRRNTPTQGPKRGFLSYTFLPKKMATKVKRSKSNGRFQVRWGELRTEVQGGEEGYPHLLLNKSEGDREQALLRQTRVHNYSPSNGPAKKV